MNNIKQLKYNFWISTWFFVFFFLVFICFFFYLVGEHYPWRQWRQIESWENRTTGTTCESEVRPDWASCRDYGNLEKGDTVIVIDKAGEFWRIKFKGSERYLYEGCIVKVECIPGWTEGEKTAFITLFVLGGMFFFVAIYCAAKLQDLAQSIANDQLIELNEIIYHNKDFDFLRLKTKVLNLKSEELDPELKTSQTRLTNLITKLQNKVNNDAKAIIDLYLQAHAQMIAQKKEHDTFVQGQLNNYEVTLQNHLTKKELQSLRTQQKETLALEERLRELKGNDHLRGN